MRDSVVSRLIELAGTDPRIFLITADLGFGVLDEYRKQFPDRFLNVGVAEQNLIGVATGMALEGHVVFTYSIANFPSLRCLEQIRNDVCYHNANVKIITVGGGFSYGPLGFSHHATEDISILRGLPGLSIVTPGDRWEAEEAVTALARTEGPFYLRLDKSYAQTIRKPGEEFRLGRSRRVFDGDDLTIIAAGGIIDIAHKAAARLLEEDISCRVLSMHTIKPPDSQAIIATAKETGGLVTLEENNISGGVGSMVAEICMDNGISPGKFLRIGIMDELCSYVGSQDYLRTKYCIDEETVVGRIKRLLDG